MFDTDLWCIGKYVNLYRDLQPAQNVWMCLWGSGINKGGAKYSKILYYLATETDNFQMEWYLKEAI